MPDLIVLSFAFSHKNKHMTLNNIGVLLCMQKNLCVHIAHTVTRVGWIRAEGCVRVGGTV